MKIRKRNGQTAEYERSKIERVIYLACSSAGISDAQEHALRLAEEVEKKLFSHGGDGIAVERIQDQVEESLMTAGLYEAAKRFILYRNEHSRARHAREQVLAHLQNRRAAEAELKQLQQEFAAEEYDLHLLTARFQSHYRGEQVDE